MGVTVCLGCEQAGEHALNCPLLMSRRSYLIVKMAESGTSPILAVDAVDNIGAAHPEWDMTEQRTWKEWENRQ